MLPIDSEYERKRPTKPQKYGSVGGDGYGAPVPVVYGRRWVSPIVLVQGSQMEKGFGWFKDSDGTWKNEPCVLASALLGLCEGPIAGVRAIMRDGTSLQVLSNTAAYLGGSGTMGVVASPQFFSGSQTDIVDPYPSGEPPYFGTACYWSTLWALKNGSWPDTKFLVDGFLGDANGVCDPVAVLQDLWSNPRYGLGLDPALLDLALGVDGNAASGYAAWVAARGWRVARAITDYEGAMDSIQSLLYETHARMFGSPDGKVKIVPLAPVPPLTPQALDQDDFLMSSESTVPMTVERVQQADVYNVVPVEIGYSTDTSADNITVAYEDTSLADAATRDIKRSDPYQAKWIVSPAHATELSFLLAQRSLKVRNRFRFKLGGRWVLLTPGDLVSLTEPVLGLSGKVAMITSTDESPRGEIQLFAEEWASQTNPPVGSPAPPEGFGDPGGEPRPDPQPAEPVDLSAIELRLANIASDARLTNDEKGYLVAQMQTIFSERSVLVATAGNFTPVEPTTNYVAATDALLAYVRAAVPANNAEATGSNGLGLPGTGDPPTAQNYSDWFLTPSGVQDGKINIVGATLRQKFGDAITEAALLKLSIADRNTGRIDNLEDFIGHVGGDGWLSSTEKRGVWSIYDGLRDEHAVLSVSAAAANIASLAAYNTAIQNLKNYAKAPQPGSGVTPVDGTAQTSPTHGLNMGLDSLGAGTLTDNPTDAQVGAWIGYDTAIHGATFRAKFSAALNASNQIYIEMAMDAWQRIQNYANDGVIAKGEKPTIFYEYVTLVAERAQIDLQADATTPLVSGTLAAAVDAEHQAYKQALWNLQNYMNDVLGCPPDAGTGSPSYVTTVPLVANLTTWEAAGTANGIAGDSAVVPATFLGYWQAVYVAKAALLRRISEESTNLAASGYQATVTLGSSKAEKDMSNITGTAISQAMARNNDLMTAALLSDEVRGDGTDPAVFLRANAIGAAAIASDVILARHILVSDFGGAALNKNPSCSDLTAWGAPSAPWPATATNVTVQALGDGKVGRSALRASSGVAAAIMSERVAVDPSKRYRLRAWARASVASLGGFRLGIMFFDGSDAPVAAPDGFGTGNYWLTPGGAQTLGTTWTESKGFFGGTGFTRGATEGGSIPATARTMAIAVLFNQGALSGYHEVQDVRIEEQVSADLMVDGSITGNKIAGGAISAGHLSVFPITQLTTDGTTMPSVLTDASVGLPATGRHPSLPCLLVDATRTVAPGPNPKVFEARFRGGTATRGFIFNVQTLAGTAQQIIAVTHDGAFIRIQTNNALDASWSTAVSKATTAPTTDEILTVHWYNSPVQAPDGNTYRCRVYVDGALVASFTTGDCGSISPSANLDLVGGYAGVILGALSGFDTALRTIDVLLGQAGVVIGDGYIGAEHIRANSIDLTRLTFTPITGGNVIASINASTEGGGTLRISANKIRISGSTTFETPDVDPRNYADSADVSQMISDFDTNSIQPDISAARAAAELLAQQLASQQVRPRIAVDLSGAAPAAPLSTSLLNASSAPGGLATRLTSTGSDPQLMFDVSGRAASEVYAVAARVRLVSGTWQGDCYYNASGLPYSDSRKVTKAAPPVGEWVVIVWDMRNAASFTSATGLTAFRLDLSATTGGVVDVDWVAVGTTGAGVSGADVQAAQDAAITSAGSAADTKIANYNTNTVQPQFLGKENSGAAANVQTAIEGQYGWPSNKTFIDGGRIWTESIVANKLAVLARNKVNNFSRLATLQGLPPVNWAMWANSGASDYYMRVTGYGSPVAPTIGYSGAWLLHLRNYDSQYLVSDPFPIDAGSDYQFNISTYRDVTGSSLYLGLLTYDGLDGTGSEIGVAYASAGSTDWTRDGASGTIYATNPYWVAGDYSAADQWHDWKLFVGGSNRALDEVPRSYAATTGQYGNPVGTGTVPVNNWDRVKFNPNVRSARVRLLNYYNNGTSRSIWFANPQVVDLSAGVIAANRIEANMIRSDVIKTSDYASTGSGAGEVASRGAKLRNNVATDAGGGTEIPAIICSPAGIKVGSKTLSQSWMNQGRVVSAYFQKSAGTYAGSWYNIVGHADGTTAIGATISGNNLPLPLGVGNQSLVASIILSGILNGNTLIVCNPSGGRTVAAGGTLNIPMMAYNGTTFSTQWSDYAFNAHVHIVLYASSF